jgi:hypothetical protein
MNSVYLYINIMLDTLNFLKYVIHNVCLEVTLFYMLTDSYF